MPALSARRASLLQLEEDEDGLGLRPTEPGRIMAHHYIRLPTMASIAQVRARLAAAHAACALGWALGHARTGKCLLVHSVPVHTRIQSIHGAAHRRLF